MDTPPPDATDPSADRRPVGPRRPRPLIVLAVALGALALLVVAWHVAALAAYGASAAGPTAERAASARLAAGLEPWNQRFAWRAVALRGLELLEQGQVDEAYFLLVPNDQAKREDLVYRLVYMRVAAEEAVRTTGKAHVAHGLDPLNDFGPGPSVPATGPPPRTIMVP